MARRRSWPSTARACSTRPAAAPGSTTSAATPGARTSTRLVESLQTEAHLTLAGRIVARTELLRALRQRLLLAERWKADPSILDEPIVAPVFVVGTGRSGTSILHELLALDPANRVPLTWELFHPGEAIGSDAEAEAARGAGHAVHAFWADLQPAYETMHHNDGDEPNECILATMLEFLSDQWGGTYEVPSYSAHLVGADHTDAYRYHRKVLQTLQRRARGERWVLKAPSHLGQLRTLFAVYPTRRVVQIHRDPLKSVPSTISLMGTLKSMRSGQVDVDALTPLVSMGYGLMLDDTLDARESRRAARRPVRRRALRRPDAGAGRHPAGRVRRARPRLARGPRRGGGRPPGRPPKGARGPHEYSLEALGLDPVVERERFRRYQQHFQVPDEI